MKNQNTLIVLFILIIFGAVFMIKSNVHKRSLNIVTGSKPFSSDPLDYDAYVHHQTFTSVFGNLVSFNKKGEITPQIAESWSHDEELKKWIFKIRKNTYYSNGDLITAHDYEMSLKRVAFVKSIEKSQSGLLEHLVGYDKITNLNELEGVFSQGNELHLNFNTPTPELLSKIAFGFYSLAHPSLYDNKTGVWKNKLKSISSGTYEVSRWDENSFELSLRKNISYVDYINAIDTISFKDLSVIKSRQIY